MVDVIDYRDSGIEVLDLDTEADDDFDDDIANVVPFRTPSDVMLEVDETVGNPIFVEGRYFVAVSITDDDPDPVTQQMLDRDAVDEASIFVSNEDGDIGGVIHNEIDADIEDMLTHFEGEAFPEVGLDESGDETTDGEEVEP